MARGKKGKKGGGQKVVVYGSDDERAYSGQHVPDPTSSEYFNDEVDDFHSNRQKILLDKGAAHLEPAGFSSDDQEGVMDIDTDDSDEDEELQNYQRQIQHFKSRGFRDKMGSDLEDEKEGLPDDKAWGKSRSKYYGADVDADIDVGSDVEDSAAALEEKEALAIQQRLAQQLDEGDFGLDLFTPPEGETPAETEKSEEKIQTDLSMLSKKEKLKLLKKESPELLELIGDYKQKMKELCERLMPIHKLIANKSLPESKGSQYVTTKVKLYLNYCVNISFYMMLKAKRSPIQNHPVIKRLLQYRNLLKQLEPADEKMAPLLEDMLQKINTGQPITVLKQKDDESSRPIRFKKKQTRKASSKKISEMLDESSSSSEDDKEESEEEDATMATHIPEGGRSWGRKRGQTEETEEHDGNDDHGNEEEMEEGDKRPIDYKIYKNKGLMPKRKKEQRNPRVKHRMKYRKALIRRKGQIRTVRTEMDRYGGEVSGIRAAKIASRKIKA